MKKYIPIIILLLFFSIVFIVSRTQFPDFDIWFHVKSGELIAQKGIIHTDVFSYTAAGREWFPYEWLFQIGVYQIQRLFGFAAIAYFLAGVSTLFTGIIYLTVRKVFKLSFFQGLLTAFLFFVSVFEFVTARPHLAAYTIYAIEFFLILKYYLSQKAAWKPLLLIIPLTLIWTNLHGSVFLSVYLPASFAFICIFQLLVTKDAGWKIKAEVFGIFALLTAILTVLPPLGTLQYRLLWIFFRERTFISGFIDEWTPLYRNPLEFYFFSVSAVCVIAFFLTMVYKRRIWREALWVLPILPNIAGLYLASRNAVLAYFTLALMFAYALKQIRFRACPQFLKILLSAACIGLVGLHTRIFINKKDAWPEMRYYPAGAVKFIKDYRLAGHMFNEYAFGGYLLYNLYPEQQVFFDGRTDVYLCCELKDVSKFSQNKYLPDDKFKKFLDGFWDKYKISFVLVRTEKNTVLRKVAKILSSDQEWSIVYWDDDSMIYLRRDGKNDGILKQFVTVAATPYDRDPFRTGMMDQALVEYEKMIKITDSAKSRNVIGFINLQKKEYDTARQEFLQAIKLNPRDESPYMNLGELSVRDGQIYDAIVFYKTAQRLAPDRGLIYIRLGQLWMQNTGDLAAAKGIWQLGLQQTIDESARQTLQKLLEQ